ncbi:MAG: DUF1207 domain-containing protein [Ignavibacteria bacterium]|nr:DUF1207 domain-containing protein [Ignavibacteria bacterium]
MNLSFKLITVRRRWCAAVLCWLIAIPHSLEAQDSTATQIQYLPGTKIFPLFTADARAHQFSLSKITEKREWIGAVGASVPVIQLDVSNVSVQASVAATIFNRLIKKPGHLEVYTIDYKVDFPVDIRIARLALRVAAGHISCHFADDAIELYGERSIQHVNDYITLAAAYDVAAIQGYLYAGANYSYGTQPIPNKPWLLQAGGDVGNIALNEFLSVYGAIDLKIKEEVGWGSTRSFQIGCKLFPRSQHQLRIAYTLRMGFEERGQFYLKKETVNLISAFLDF